ncbi:MAG: hypothetical protein AB7I32_12030 [Gammaproteobacteria bacterium]
MSARPSFWMRALACCLLLVLSSSVLADASAALGKVLCLGGDGHVAIELAHGGDCADFVDVERDRDAAARRTASASHCGDCLDIVLVSPSASTPSRADDPVASPAPDHTPIAVFLAFMLAEAPAPAPRAFFTLHAAPPDLFLLIHRTDVLLV